MQGPELVLRDVHVPPAPSLWPPAPGWWLVAALAVVVMFAVWWLRRQRRRRLQSWLRLFDDACADPSPTAQVAGISELLRRAAREVDTQADRLQGEHWLKFLDGDQPGQFSEGVGTLLLEGGYRREVDIESVQALQQLARTRFLQLMAARRR